MYNLSGFILKLLVAFAAAELTTFNTIGAIALFVFNKIACASLTSLPLTKSTTNLAFLTSLISVDIELALKIIDAYVNATFEERHQKRIDKIKENFYLWSIIK